MNKLLNKILNIFKRKNKKVIPGTKRMCYCGENETYCSITYYSTTYGLTAEGHENCENVKKEMLDNDIITVINNNVNKT